MSNDQILPSEGQTITFNVNDSSWSINQAQNRPLIPEVKTFEATYGDTTILPLRQPQNQIQTQTINPNDMVTITKCPPGSQGYVSEPAGSSKDAKNAVSLGFRPCNAPLEAKSEAELRKKGTSILRRHASKHGIINSSRKRIDTVVKELSQHYLNVHKFALIPEPERPAKPVKAEPNKDPLAIKTSYSGSASSGHADSNGSYGGLEMQSFFPQTNLYQSAANLQSLPSGGFAYQNPAIQQHQVSLPIHPIPQQTYDSSHNRILNANSLNCQKKTPKGNAKAVKSEPNTSKAQFCNSPIVAKSKGELSALGTSKLRPEASSHKVFNSSRKCKQEVVAELWEHYQTHHASEIVGNQPQLAQQLQIQMQQPAFQPQRVMTAVGEMLLQQSQCGASGWVGHIADDEDENSSQVSNNTNMSTH